MAVFPPADYYNVIVCIYFLFFHSLLAVMSSMIWFDFKKLLIICRGLRSPQGGDKLEVGPLQCGLHTCCTKQPLLLSLPIIPMHGTVRR